LCRCKGLEAEANFRTDLDTVACIFVHNDALISASVNDSKLKNCVCHWDQRTKESIDVAIVKKNALSLINVNVL
jgi:hypothetical protein